MTEPADVVDDQERSRFVVEEDGATAQLVYRLQGDVLDLLHTEVPEALGGRGVGGALVEAALGRAGRDGLRLVPTCGYARSWLRKHPDAIGGVPVDWPDGQG
jgi:predicted GNAT family acetyltransferase